MIAESKWLEGWALLVGAFGGHLTSEAARETYGVVLRPLMDDETWARTVLSALHGEGGPPPLRSLIARADAARQPNVPAASEVARAREACPRIDVDNFARLMAHSCLEGTTIERAAELLLDPGGRLVAFVPRTGPRA